MTANLVSCAGTKEMHTNGETRVFLPGSPPGTRRNSEVDAPLSWKPRGAPCLRLEEVLYFRSPSGRTVRPCTELMRIPAEAYHAIKEQTIPS